MRMDTTETVTSGIEIGTATETGTAETTGVELPVGDVQEILMTTDVLMTKIDAVIIDVTMTTVTVEVVVKMLVRPTTVVAEEGEEMVLALLKEGPQHPKVLFHCLSENGKHQGGTYMLPGMSNIQPCKRSKLGFSICQALTVPRSRPF
jgi:hypothetical protein